METQSFKNPAEVKQTIPSSDYVKPYWVSNISGNKYRLITIIDFKLAIVSVEYVLTHAEYNRGRWR